MNIYEKLLEGRPHFVVPVVMAVEGVLNGSSGPLFYPGEELRGSVWQWNGRPVVVYHPSMQHGGLAGNPEIFNQQKVGTLFSARYEGRALKADAWLDTERLAIVDPRIYRAVNKRQMVEVSTGLHLDVDEKPGVFNGREYTAVARNFRPDHLAILPDQEGACSIADGAGLCRNEETRTVEPLLEPVYSN